MRSSLAAVVTGVLVIATFLLDTLGRGAQAARVRCSTCRSTSTSGSRWPGIFDPVGVVVAALMAIGGLAVGTWGLQRRDIGR